MLDSELGYYSLYVKVHSIQPLLGHDILPSHNYYNKSLSFLLLLFIWHNWWVSAARVGLLHWNVGVMVHSKHWGNCTIWTSLIQLFIHVLTGLTFSIHYNTMMRQESTMNDIWTSSVCLGKILRFLHTSAKTGRMDAFKLLLSPSITTPSTVSITHCTPLYWISTNGIFHAFVRMNINCTNYFTLTSFSVKIWGFSEAWGEDVEECREGHQGTEGAMQHSLCQLSDGNDAIGVEAPVAQEDHQVPHVSHASIQQPRHGLKWWERDEKLDVGKISVNEKRITKC